MSEEMDTSGSKEKRMVANAERTQEDALLTTKAQTHSHNYLSSKIGNEPYKFDSMLNLITLKVQSTVAGGHL